MRNIRLSGREGSVVKAIGFSLPIPAAELQERTGLPPDELTDVINTLLNAGYIESVPFKDQIVEANLATIELEVNPAFARELRKATRMGGSSSSQKSAEEF